MPYNFISEIYTFPRSKIFLRDEFAWPTQLVKSFGWKSILAIFLFYSANYYYYYSAIKNLFLLLLLTHVKTEMNWKKVFHARAERENEKEGGRT